MVPEIYGVTTKEEELFLKDILLYATKNNCPTRYITL